jgi:hypothetical protein
MKMMTLAGTFPKFVGRDYKENSNNAALSVTH